VSVFDFERFNGFARKGLDDLLFRDLWEHYIFNESDMHSAAYYYIRDFFKKKGRGKYFVRCEPMLAGMKPDIVIYTLGKPTYVLEFKMFSKLDVVNNNAVINDLEKLSTAIENLPTVKWGFFHMIYDADIPYTISDNRLRRAGLKRMSVTTINARRTEDTGRRRIGYDEWREIFDGMRAEHNEYA
jgi:hypothetical protein